MAFFESEKNKNLEYYSYSISDESYQAGQKKTVLSGIPGGTYLVIMSCSGIYPVDGGILRLAYNNQIVPTGSFAFGMNARGGGGKHETTVKIITLPNSTNTIQINENSGDKAISECYYDLILFRLA